MPFKTEGCTKLLYSRTIFLLKVKLARSEHYIKFVERIKNLAYFRTITLIILLEFIVWSKKYMPSKFKHLNFLISGLKCLLCVFVCQRKKFGWTCEFVHGYIYIHICTYIFIYIYIYITLVSLWLCKQN